MQRTSTLPAGLAGLALVALPACDLVFPEEELHLVYDEQRDTLDALFVFHGISAPGGSEPEIANAVAAAERALGGRRELLIIDWPAYWDLDELAEEEELDEAERSLLANVTVVEAGGFFDETGRLCGWQHVRLTDVQLALDHLNRSLCAELLAAEEREGGLARELDWLPARDVELFLEWARRGASFVALDRDGPRIDLPCTPEGAGAHLGVYTRFIAQVGDDDDIEPLLSALEGIRSIEVADGRLRIRLGHLEGGVVRFSFANPRAEVSPALAEALAARGHDFTAGPTLEEVYAKVGSPAGSVEDDREERR